jgi:glucokinase
MFLGVEIGGTKLQLGVGDAGAGGLVALERAAIVPADGALGILRQIEQIARPLIAKHGVQAVGFGFGGPIDINHGRVVKSHHVAGWDGFALVDWCQKTLDRPAAIGNDSDMAGLGEARFGAGLGHRVVFYTNAGSGIGGSLVVGGRVYIGGSGIAAEIGHLRPGLDADAPTKIVELAASGWAIASAARADAQLAGELARQFNCPVENVTARHVADAAAAGNPAALRIFRRATQTYGWAIAQMITLLSPEVVVVGGGVSLAGETLFFEPLRREVERYAFPPHRGTYKIVSAKLGEEVVIFGALALARAMAEHGDAGELFIP